MSSQADSSRTRRELNSNQIIVTTTYDCANTIANTTTDSSGITVTGAADGDPVIVGVPAASISASGTWSAYVSAADTVKIRYSNNTAGAINPASGSFKIIVLKYPNYTVVSE